MVSTISDELEVVGRGGLVYCVLLTGPADKPDVPEFTWLCDNECYMLKC